MIEKSRKRMSGGFFTVHVGLTMCWITENYHLYKDNAKYCVSERDEEELYKARQAFIKCADVMDVEDCRYVVDFPPQFSPAQKIKLVEVFHNGRTRTMRFDD